MAYEPPERLKAMDLDHVDYSVLYPIVGGLAAESFGKLEDPDLELACVQAYNDWLIEEWAGISPRFVPAMYRAHLADGANRRGDQARRGQRPQRSDLSGLADGAARRAPH